MAMALAWVEMRAVGSFWGQAVRVTFPGVVFIQTEILVGVTWPTSGPAIRVRGAGESWDGRIEPKPVLAALAELEESANPKARRATASEEV